VLSLPRRNSELNTKLNWLLAHDMKAITLLKRLPIAQLMIALLVGIPVFIAILNHFYCAGDLTDPGQQARIGWRNDWWLPSPSPDKTTFLSTHLALIFWPINLISYVLPLDVISFYGLFQAFIYATYATAIFEAWQSFVLKPESTRFVGALSGAVVAVLATFSAVGMQSLKLAHSELLIPALALWFFVFLRKQETYKAIAAFTLCLMVREDAGLHLFGVIFLILLGTHIQKKNFPESKQLMMFGICGLIYAVLAFFIRGSLPGHWNNFASVYSGTPAWDHITNEFIINRLRFYTIHRSYIWIPIVLSVIWSFLASDLLILVGYFAFIPWLIISFFAVFSTSGEMGYYYAFPFWFSLAWPVISYNWIQSDDNYNKKYNFFVFFGFILIASNVSINGFKIYMADNNFFPSHPFVITDEVMHKKEADAAFAYLITNKDLLEMNTTAVDGAANGFLMDITSSKNNVDSHFWKEQSQLPRIIVYFEQAFNQNDIRDLLNSNSYQFLYFVPNTRIKIASQVDLGEILPQPMPFNRAIDP